MIDKLQIKAQDPGPPGGPFMLPISNLITYSDSGGKVVQEYQVRFDATISSMVKKMTQSQAKYDQFWAEYPSWEI